MNEAREKKTVIIFPIFLMTLLAIVVLLLTSCSQGTSDASGNDASSSTSGSSQAMNEAQGEDTNNSTGDPQEADETQTAADGRSANIDFFSVQKSDALGFYLAKGDSLYSLNKFPSGTDWNAAANGNYIGTNALYINNGDEIRWSYPDEMYLFPTSLRVVALETAGAIPTYEQGDDIRYYSSKDVSDLWMVRVDGVGYATRLRELTSNGSHTSIYYGELSKGFYVGDTLPRSGDYSIVDSAGAKHDPADIYGFAKGETVTISWHEGTAYREITLGADYPAYGVAPYPTEVRNHVEYVQPDAVIRIAGELTKEGYATYDISSVDPGIYVTSQGGLLQIAG